jgi:flagellar biosynthesis protein FliQ
MTPDTIIEIASDAIFTLLMVASPILGVALSVGLVISLVQALTQMQEMTLSFVPKVTAMVVTFFLALPFMMATMIGLGERLFERIATTG